MRERADENAVWLFPARRKSGHRTDIKEVWQVLRATANIPDVRTHDLRHSFASVLASQGMSLPIIGALLGHASPTTTARYAHLLDDPLRRATEAAAAVITGAPSAEVVKHVRLQMFLDNFGGVGTEALARLGLEFKRLSSGVAIVAA
jgi:hypothetical protein